MLYANHSILTVKLDLKEKFHSSILFRKVCEISEKNKGTEVDITKCLNETLGLFTTVQGNVGISGMTESNRMTGEKKIS